MKTLAIPKGLAQLRPKLKSELGATKVEFEKIPGAKRYRIAVVSPRFKHKNHLKRQDEIWQVVDDTLSRIESLRISLILAYAPEELGSAKIGSSRKRTRKKTVPR